MTRNPSVRVPMPAKKEGAQSIDADATYCTYEVQWAWSTLMRQCSTIWKKNVRSSNPKPTYAYQVGFEQIDPALSARSWGTCSWNARCAVLIQKDDDTPRAY